MACVTPEIFFYSSSHIGFCTLYQTEVTDSETCDFREILILGHLRVTVTTGENIYFKEIIKKKIRWQWDYMLGLLTERSELKYSKNVLQNKNVVLEMPGLEPGAFRMQSERSTAELHPQHKYFLQFISALYIFFITIAF